MTFLLSLAVRKYIADMYSIPYRYAFRGNLFLNDLSITAYVILALLALLFVVHVTLSLFYFGYLHPQHWSLSQGLISGNAYTEYVTGRYDWPLTPDKYTVDPSLIPDGRYNL